MLEGAAGEGILSAQKGSAHTARNTVVVGGRFQTYQRFPWLGHGGAPWWRLVSYPFLYYIPSLALVNARVSSAGARTMAQNGDTVTGGWRSLRSAGRGTTLQTWTDHGPFANAGCPFLCPLFAPTSRGRISKAPWDAHDSCADRPLPPQNRVESGIRGQSPTFLPTPENGPRPPSPTDTRSPAVRGGAVARERRHAPACKDARRDVSRRHSPACQPATRYAPCRRWKRRQVTPVS